MEAKQPFSCSCFLFFCQPDLLEKRCPVLLALLPQESLLCAKAKRQLKAPRGILWRFIETKSLFIETIWAFIETKSHFIETIWAFIEKQALSIKEINHTFWWWARLYKNSKMLGIIINWEKKIMIRLNLV